MDMYGRVKMCVIAYGHAYGCVWCLWICMNVYGCQCMFMCVCMCMNMYVGVYLAGAGRWQIFMYIYIYINILMCRDVYDCLWACVHMCGVYGFVWICMDL